jgi:hypothetical protein
MIPSQRGAFNNPVSNTALTIDRPQVKSIKLPDTFNILLQSTYFLILDYLSRPY